MSEAKLSSKNQIVIPCEAREALGLKPGDQIPVVVSGERLIILRKPEHYHAAIRGLGRNAFPKDHLKKERRSWE